MKRIVILALLLLMLTALMSSASARITETGLDQRYSIIVDDQRDLLTDQEENDLVEVMRPISQYGSVVFLTSSGGFGSNDEKALSYLQANVSTDRSFPVTLFHIDMGSRQLTIFSRGSLYQSLPTSSAYTITGNVARYATSRNYYRCAKEAFEQILEQVQTGHVASYMSWAHSALLALAIALFASFKVVHRDKEKRWNQLGSSLSALNFSKVTDISISNEKLVRQSKEARASDSSSCGSSCSSCGGGGSSCSSCGGGGSSGF